MHVVKIRISALVIDFLFWNFRKWSLTICFFQNMLFLYDMLQTGVDVLSHSLLLIESIKNIINQHENKTEESPGPGIGRTEDRTGWRV